MKYVILLILAWAAATLGAEPGREIAKKELTRRFASLEEASRWNFTDVPFSEWLDAVTFPGWRLLHSEQTDESYCALFHGGDHLILWRMGRESGARAPAGQISIDVTAKRDGRSVWETPPSGRRSNIGSNTRMGLFRTARRAMHSRSRKAFTTLWFSG